MTSHAYTATITSPSDEALTHAGGDTTYTAVAAVVYKLAKQLDAVTGEGLDHAMAEVQRDLETGMLCLNVR